MKLKYYLRGLGIGMLVVALVLVASGKVGAKMSDEAVKRRAAQLGMVEKDTTVLGDIVGEDLPPQANAGAQAGAEAPAESAPAEADTPVTEAPVADVPQPEETLGNDAPKPAEEAAQPEEAPEAQGGADVSAEMPEAEKPQAPAGDAGGQQAMPGTEERADEVKDRAEEVAQNAPQGRTVTLEVRRGDSSVSVAQRAEEVGLVRSAKDFDKFLCQNGYDKKISVGNYEIPEGASEKDIADIVTKRK